MCLLRRRRSLFRVARCALSHGALGLALAGCAMTADHAPFAFVVPSQFEAGGLQPETPPIWVSAPLHLSDAEQEAVIAAAIAEHEIRQP